MSVARRVPVTLAGQSDGGILGTSRVFGQSEARSVVFRETRACRLVVLLHQVIPSKEEFPRPRKLQNRHSLSPNVD